jgi:starvation-inducible outer membrane lipoprotein
MKTTGILLLVLTLGACVSVPTLEELEHQAMLTGDWSAVEARERRIAHRSARQGPGCPSGTVAYCEQQVSSERCTCVDHSALSAIFVR